MPHTYTHICESTIVLFLYLVCDVNSFFSSNAPDVNSEVNCQTSHSVDG